MENWINKKILVVEDEFVNFMLIKAFLDATKIQITHASNGKKAVDFCLADQFDVIFMDINMPIMDGFGATSEIRKFNKDVSIIAQTAYAYKREECLARGFSDYVSKPFNRNQLLQILKKYIVD